MCLSQFSLKWLKHGEAFSSDWLTINGIGSLVLTNPTFGIINFTLLPLVAVAQTEKSLHANFGTLFSDACLGVLIVNSIFK